MTPIVPCLLAGLLTAQPAPGDEPPPPYTLVKLTVHPAAEPLPALRYRLLPPAREQTAGNAALLYYRAYSPDWLTHRREPGQAMKLSDYLTKPLKELPRDELKWLPEYRPLQEVDRAARRTYCDWDLAGRAREDGINLLLPDVQGFREFAVLLALRARLEIADGQFDKAVYTLQTGYALGRHVAEGPTLIHYLVGAAITAVITQQLDTLLEQPGAPNLYWALTDLPHPFASIRKAAEGEANILSGYFPAREELEDPATPASLIQAKLEEGFRRFEDGPGRKSTDAGRKFILPHALMHYPTAKRQLIAEGRPPEQVEAMPVIQVVAIVGLRAHYRLHDNVYKWLGQPYPVALAGMARAEQLDLHLKHDSETQMSVVFAMMGTHLHKVFLAEARTERRFAALRVVEALRLHAAAHGGKLPARLADVTAVPVPDDPITGKPFEYRLEGGTAVLFGPTPPGDQPGSRNALRYEITLQR